MKTAMKKWSKVGMLALLAASLFCTMLSQAFADGEKASIGILCQYKEKPIVGVQFTATLIATAKVDADSHTIVYELVPEMASYSKKDKFGIERAFQKMTAAESNALAAEVSKLTFDASLQYTAKTDKDGYAFFTDLPLGMYLITQTGADKTAADYSEYKPFLCDVPYMEEGKVYYDRSVLPKSTVTYTAPVEDKDTPGDDDKDLPPDEDKDVPPVKTDDEAPVGLLLGATGGCILLLAGLIVLRLGENKKENAR
jgi:hypothetical protein